MASFEDDIGPLAFYMARTAVVPRHNLSAALMEAMKETGRRVADLPMPGFIAERTSLEKKLLLTAGLYTGWLVCRSGMLGRISKYAGWVTPGFNWLKTRLGSYSVVIDPQVRSTKMVLESRRAGSEEQNFTTTKCQVQIGTLREGEFAVLGSAVRFDGDFFVGPDHVLGGDDIEEKYINGHQGLVSLRGKERIPLATDMVAIWLTPAEAVKVGARVCAMGSLIDSAYVQVVGPVSKGTTGVLKNDPYVFGRVVYSGTTLGGYSGSAYMAGDKILGIHQSGGAVNGGYSVTYLWMQLKQHLKERPEGSEDWLLGQFRAGRMLKWQETMDPDFVQVFAEGKYSMVEKDSMARAFGEQWRNLGHSFDIRAKQAYDDAILESVSGEASSSRFPGASSIVGKCQDSEGQDPLGVLSEYQKLSPEQQESFRKLLGKPRKQKPNTSGQVNQAQ